MIKSKKALLTVIICVTAAISAILITCGFALKENQNEDKKWVLKAYKNSVALYHGEDVIEVYDSIEISTLPEDDVRMLTNGIAFQTKGEALTTIEDYDG